jgi:hypothetical protein
MIIKQFVAAREQVLFTLPKQAITTLKAIRRYVLLHNIRIRLDINSQSE